MKPQANEVSGNEALTTLAETIHLARWPDDRTPEPFAHASANDREYAYRIARAVAALPPSVEYARGVEAGNKPAAISVLFGEFIPAINPTEGDIEYYGEIVDRVLAAYGTPAPDTVSVPRGWKLVPEEPTPEMIGAWWRQKNTGTQVLGATGPDSSDYDAYRAMLANAPLQAHGDDEDRSFAALLEEHILSIPAGALNALRNQTQLDEEGIMVGVSREAVDEVLTGVNAAIHAYWNMPAVLSKDAERPVPTNIEAQP
jgi:hypothetical protein